MPRKPHVSPATADAPIMGLRRPWAGNYWPPGHTHIGWSLATLRHWAVRRVRGPASPRWSAHTWATFTGLGFSCDNQGLAACACLYLSMAVSQEGWSKWGSGGRNCLVISVGLCTCAGRAPHTLCTTAQLFLSCPGDHCAPLTCYWHADNVCGLQPPPDSSVTTSVSVGPRRGCDIVTEGDDRSEPSAVSAVTSADCRRCSWADCSAPASSCPCTSSSRARACSCRASVSRRTMTTWRTHSPGPWRPRPTMATSGLCTRTEPPRWRAPRRARDTPGVSRGETSGTGPRELWGRWPRSPGASRASPASPWWITATRTTRPTPRLTWAKRTSSFVWWRR